jgi:hypothetical protein
MGMFNWTCVCFAALLAVVACKNDPAPTNRAASSLSLRLEFPPISLARKARLGEVGELL